MSDYTNRRFFKSDRIRNTILLIAAAIAIVIGMSISAKGDIDKSAKTEQTDETLQLLYAGQDPRVIETLVLKMGIEDVAERHGSPDSERFAMAALQSRYPRLITGIGVAEKGQFNPHCKPGAIGEKGFSQIYEPQWGVVGDTIEAQVEKTDEVLGKLLLESNGDEEQAIRKYSAGARWRCDDAKQYANTVLAIAKGL